MHVASSITPFPTRSTLSKLKPRSNNNVVVAFLTLLAGLRQVKRAQEVVGRDHAVPLVLGPNTLVGIATLAPGADRSALVARLVPAYVDVLKQLKVRVACKLLLLGLAAVVQGFETLSIRAGAKVFSRHRACSSNV